MKELVIISGKGGTGKTSVTASFAVLAGRPVIADCDVDAPDLHLVLSPRINERHEFRSGHEAIIREEDCIGCGVCLANCRFGAVRMDRMAAAEASVLSPELGDKFSRALRPAGKARRPRIVGLFEARGPARSAGRESLKGATPPDGMPRPENVGAFRTQDTRFSIDPVACEGCGVCVRFCPEKAIDFPERLCGEWMISETRCGPMVHARLGVAAENSGKLVSTVRREARRIADEEHRSLVIVDGPPGIGCPVIASVTGATLVLTVTEPTVSGEHDLERVLSLTRHFNILTAICVNKWDLNPEMTERIEDKARRAGVRVVGRIRYDREVTLAQMQERAVVETEAPCVEDVQGIWKQLGL